MTDSIHFQERGASFLHAPCLLYHDSGERPPPSIVFLDLNGCGFEISCYQKSIVHYNL